MPKQNLGSIELQENDLITAGHSCVIKTMPVKSGINYPVGACVEYDTTEKVFKPSVIGSSKNFIVAYPIDGTDETEVFAQLLLHGSINKDAVKKADSATDFTKWLDISYEDYINLINNSNIV